MGNSGGEMGVRGCKAFYTFDRGTNLGVETWPPIALVDVPAR